jgi:hypothetical protein
METAVIRMTALVPSLEKAISNPMKGSIENCSKRMPI